MSLTTDRPSIIQPADTLPPALKEHTALYEDRDGRTITARVRRYRLRDGGVALVLDDLDGPPDDYVVLRGRAHHAAWTAAGSPRNCRFFEHLPATSDSALPDNALKGEVITEYVFPRGAAPIPIAITEHHHTAFVRPTSYDLNLGDFWILTHPAHHTGQMPTWVIYGYPPGATSADQGRYFRLEPGKTFDWPRWVEERERAHWCPTPGDVIIAQEIARGERWTVRVRQLAAWEVGA